MPEIDSFASSTGEFDIITLRNFPAGVDAWRTPGSSSINWHELLEEDLVANFFVLPNYHEDETMHGRPLNILTALLRRRDKFATRSTWLAQRAWTP